MLEREPEYPGAIEEILEIEDELGDWAKQNIFIENEKWAEPSEKVERQEAWAELYRITKRYERVMRAKMTNAR